MDDFNSESDSDYTSYWRDWAISFRDGSLTDHREGGIDIVSQISTMTFGPTDTDGHSFPESQPSPGPPPVLSRSSGNRVKASKKRRASEVEDLDIPLRLVPRRFPIKERVEPLEAMDNLGYLLATSPGHAMQTLSPSSSNFPFPRLSSIGSSPNSTESDGTLKTYRARFISSRGNEYFCEIDEDYLTDRFNLTGLQTEVQYYQYALDLVTDVFDLDCDDEMRETIEKSARHLYGLVHARYIVTTRGLAKMLEKYKKADFGKCPRVMCKSHPLLPMGQSDNPNIKAVKLYCARCEDIYNPKSSRHSAIDGAYFGTSFHNILFQVYPAMIPAKSYDRYVPRIYGFKVHAPAALIRWQNGERDEMRRRLRKLEIESGFKDEDGEEMDESEEEEEDEEELEGLGNGQVVGGDVAGRS